MENLNLTIGQQGDNKGIYSYEIKKFVCNAKSPPLPLGRWRWLECNERRRGLAQLRSARPLRRASLATSPASRGGQKTKETP
jgi:hypothetical protein